MAQEDFKIKPGENKMNLTKPNSNAERYLRKQGNINKPSGDVLVLPDSTYQQDQRAEAQREKRNNTLATIAIAGAITGFAALTAWVGLRAAGEEYLPAKQNKTIYINK